MWRKYQFGSNCQCRNLQKVKLKVHSRKKNLKSIQKNKYTVFLKHMLLKNPIKRIMEIEFNDTC